MTDISDFKWKSKKEASFYHGKVKYRVKIEPLGFSYCSPVFLRVRDFIWDSEVDNDNVNTMLMTEYNNLGPDRAKAWVIRSFKEIVSLQNSWNEVID